MRAETIRIRSSEGPGFDCYVAAPRTARKVPAIVLASAIHGVDEDLREISDAFGRHGYLAVAPDLFWRTVPGALPRGDPRAASRGQPRLERIRAGERDLVDVLAALSAESLWSGRAALIGFCYGGPYAILGPKRLGYDAGIACHGTQMLDFVGESAGVGKPVCVLWGDQDRMAPPEVLAAYRRAAAHTETVTLQVFPGVQHGYMMLSSPAFDPDARRVSMEHALAMLENLR
jgi:carboxymethylenebutenolidase